MMNESLLFTEKTQAQDGRPLELRYSLLAEDGADGTASYGVAVRCLDEQGPNQREVPGITADRERAVELLRLLAQGTVTPTGLMDVLSDWL